MEISDLTCLIKSDRVHRELYTSEEIFKLEQKYLFSRAWIYLAHESQLPDIGSYITTTIASQPVIVLRQTDGNIGVFHNRCPHRGVVLLNNSCGCTGKSIQCPYHGWTFSTKGKLLMAPLPDGYKGSYDMRSDPQFSMAEIGGVGSYKGFIFGRLEIGDKITPSFEQYLSTTARECIDKIVSRSPEGTVDLSRGTHRYFVHANWKTQIENLNDNYHPPFSHASTMDENSRQFRRRYGDQEGAFFDTKEDNKTWDSVDSVPLDWGMSYCGRLPFNDEDRGGPAVNELKEKLRRNYSAEKVEEIMIDSFHNLIMYPSVVFQLASSHVRRIRPISKKLTEVLVTPICLNGAPKEINDALIKFINITHSAAALIQSDDVENFRRAQTGLASTALDWVWFNRYMQDDGKPHGRGTSEVVMRNQYHTGYAHYMKEVIDD